MKAFKAAVIKKLLKKPEKHPDLLATIYLHLTFPSFLKFFEKPLQTNKVIDYIGLVRLKITQSTLEYIIALKVTADLLMAADNANIS